MMLNMKMIITTTLILCGIGSSYAQQDLINTLQKQAVTNDSLNKVINKYEQSDNENRVKLLSLQDTIKILKSDLSKLEKFKAEKKNLDNQLKHKSDSVTILKSNLSDKDKQLKNKEQKTKQEVKEARESSKNEIVTRIVGYYKNKSFDDLIKLSTQQSILNDRQIFGSTTDIESLLSDLEKYFTAKKLLENKLDATKIKNAEKQLSQIKLESTSLDKLINTVENYQILNDGLKETINKIMALDGQESVVGLSKETQNKKFIKIMTDISYYIFNYDFNHLDYPYLSDVVLEIIKRKAPNPDADISDLLKKL
jgi:hypothetical protein